MRSIDKIWTDIQKYEVENEGRLPRYISVKDNIIDKISEDLKDLYELENVSLDMLEKYFGIEIVVDRESNEEVRVL